MGVACCPVVSSEWMGLDFKMTVAKVPEKLHVCVICEGDNLHLKKGLPIEHCRKRRR